MPEQVADGVQRHAPLDQACAKPSRRDWLSDWWKLFVSPCTSMGGERGGPSRPATPAAPTLEGHRLEARLLHRCPDPSGICRIGLVAPYERLDQPPRTGSKESARRASGWGTDGHRSRDVAEGICLFSNRPRATMIFRANKNIAREGLCPTQLRPRECCDSAHERA